MLRTPPFRRAAFLLFRNRAVLAAMIGAGAILGLVVALTPQFSSAASSAALQRELAGRCGSSYAGSLAPGLGFEPGFRFPGVTAENRERIAEAVGTQRNLAPPRATIIGRGLFLAPGNDPEAGFNLNLLYRDDYEDHVEVLEGGEKSGLWIDSYAASQYDVALGDVLAYEFTVTLADDTQRTIRGEMEVTAITEELVGLRSTDYWCGVGDLIGLSPTGDRLTPVGLVPIDTFGDGVVSELEDPPDDYFLRGQEYWEIPVEESGLTIGIAGEILDTFTEVGREVMFRPDGVRSDLGQVRDLVIAVDGALLSSIRPLSLAVTIVALGLLALSASYWVDRRSSELRLLNASGLGPVAIGVKAFLESAIPVATGVLGGWLLSIPLAVLVSPGNDVEGSALVSGLALSGVGFVAAMSLVAVVAGFRSRALTTTHRRASRWNWWALPLAAGCFISAFLIHDVVADGAVVFVGSQLVGSVDPLVILYPILIFGGGALVGARSLSWLLGISKDAFRGPAAYMATRRLTSSPGPVMVLLAGALIPVATLVYSAALTRSADHSIQAKGRVFIGSEVRAPIYEFEPLPATLRDVSTYVRRAERVEIEGIETDFMVVDTNTFPQGAFWDPDFSDNTLPGLLGLIAGNTRPLQAIAANGELQVEEGVVDLSRIEVPVEIVAMTTSFPGARGDRPLLIVGREAFESYVADLDLPPPQRDGTLKYLWTKEPDPDVVERALNDADIGFAFTTTVDEALDLTKFQVVIWTFDFLELYAALAGVIVIGAIVLYADTRQRSRNLSYALALRMGLSRSQHLVAGFLEIAAVVVSGAALGALIAYLAAISIYPALDALPETPPAPGWAGALDLSLLLIVVALVVSGLAAWVAQRTADRADIAALLRHGE